MGHRAQLQRYDGTSRFRPAHSTVYSSTEILSGEAPLLQRAADVESAPVVDLDVIEVETSRDVDGQMLSDEQSHALAAIATSGRQVDLLIGPAGAGKTTAMRALRSAWSSAHGPTRG